MLALLSAEFAARLLSDQLRIAATQLAAMRDVGELDALALDTRWELVGLTQFLFGAADAARGMEGRRG